MIGSVPSPGAARVIWAGSSPHGACRNWSRYCGTTISPTSAGNTAADPARRGGVVAGHQDLESQQRTRVQREAGAGARLVRQSACRRARGLRGRVRAAEPATPRRARLVWSANTETAVCDLQPHPGRAAHARCAGSSYRAALLPHPRPQTLDRVPGLPRVPAPTVARSEVVSGRRQLFGPQTPRGAGMVRRQRRGIGVLADLLVLVEPHRVRVLRVAVLRTRRHRPPQPRRAGRRDRRLHPLA